MQDLIATDLGMVAVRTNLQARDAIELTRFAVERAADINRSSDANVEVTVTGHSLGGSLAQITAHHFDLRHPEHSRHQMFAQVRDKLAEAYVRLNAPVNNPDTLDQLAAEAVVRSRAKMMEQISEVELTFPNGAQQPPNILIYEDNSRLSLVSEILGEELSQLKDVSTLSAELVQVEQHVAAKRHKWDQEQERLNREGGPVLRLRPQPPPDDPTTG